ncbi:MAG: hypothetical protein H6742_20580 [Alphaproteobacteria bacterium]|nr:hypothetical protein [Alphaproteobacteria bacterium]
MSLLLLAASLSNPAMAWDLFIDPDLCYADSSLEAWVEGIADGASTEWDLDDAFWDAGGTIDVVDSDGIFVTCPPCPPAVDGDTYTLTVQVDDGGGTTSDTLTLEQSCDASPKGDGVACAVGPAGGGLLLAALAMVLPLRRRRV